MGGGSGNFDDVRFHSHDITEISILAGSLWGTCGCLFALITARHLGFDHAKPRPGAIFMRLFFCYGPPFSNPPIRASIRCNIHEVCLLSRPGIWDFCTQNLDQVQYS